MSEISDSSAPAPSQPLPAWKIWANPIWRRYARARLRTKHLVVCLTLTLLPASFILFGIEVLVLYRAQLPSNNAGFMQFLFLFGLQATILFTLGTGQSAGGITAEADEGMLEYQRLTPLTPLAKVFGYLFRTADPRVRHGSCHDALHYLCDLEWRHARRESGFHLVFLSATILYHLTGLVAGTVAENRRWAFFGFNCRRHPSLHGHSATLKFGLVFFKYLAILPSAIDGFERLADESALGGRAQRSSHNAARSIAAGRNCTVRRADFSPLGLYAAHAERIYSRVHRHALAPVASRRITSSQEALGRRAIRLGRFSCWGVRCR